MVYLRLLGKPARSCECGSGGQTSTAYYMCLCGHSILNFLRMPPCATFPTGCTPSAAPIRIRGKWTFVPPIFPWGLT